MTLNYLKENIDITSLSNFKTKAEAKYYFEIHNRQDVEKLSDIYTFANDNKLDILFIGGGTNMLFAFDLYKGIIINNCLEGWNYDNESKILSSFSKENISDIALELENNFNQNLWHRFIGLPGSIGGALFGNAGCFGLETENNFLEAEVYNYITGVFEILTKKEIEFEYRNSIFKKTNKYFIINVKFDLSTKIEKYSSNTDNLYFREYKQPKGNTCGSFFKNPSKEVSAGSLIEQVGLKGISIGSAYFSGLHANFLMSEDNGNYKDLLKLINSAQEKVLKQEGISIIPEVRIIYNK